jgi:hypothetical protein
MIWARGLVGRRPDTRASRRHEEDEMARSAWWWMAVCFCLAAGALPTAMTTASDLLVDSGERLGKEVSWQVALGGVDGCGDPDLFIAFLTLVGPPYEHTSHPNEVWINTTRE